MKAAELERILDEGDDLTTAVMAMVLTQLRRGDRHLAEGVSLLFDPARNCPDEGCIATEAQLMAQLEALGLGRIVPHAEAIEWGHLALAALERGLPGAIGHVQWLATRRAAN